ncbi:MAG: bifunctional (p)ppGpp synthetase/guanosine-3',5'-bis(diphosphate) 3'-pyrophosphohydrolase [Hyphomicrobiales bacterium]|nr:bifunctional (p)ppGpp synthetase/guanosine-3',5'-bis(diphosphate) 3'-pyrophosphohydrolase [Hyphomicrobiales bacterium]
MMRQFELVEKVRSYDPRADETLLNKAYVFALKAHGKQKRASGDPYFSHPLAVAEILTRLKLDDATIATALLHDTIEDTGATKADIDRMFGPVIGDLVNGVTKIKRLNLYTNRTEQAENFRKLLVAISSDIRVLLVKLADRLHNMRTLEWMRPDKRLVIAQETMDIYAPLAGRMGIQEMRSELEDLAFRWLNPEAYQAVTSRLAVLRERNQGLTAEIEAELMTKLGGEGIVLEVKSREKKPYAIWRKMENRQISLEQLSDIYGFRVIVAEPDHCYKVLGVIHTTWRAVPGRFKDYVSNPKQNGYQSLHTTIIGPRHQRVELQVRTRDMDRVAEFGVAAHALYKDGINGATRRNGANGVHGDAMEPYEWLRRLVSNLLEGDNPEEFLENTKLELFQDQVFCFTPKGRLIALPRGATPIDFAYAVHTTVGNRCVGAKINGRHMPLMSQLRNGDEVEIVTSEAQKPSPAWEAIVATGKARSAIRRATREAVRSQFGALGWDILTNAFERAGKTVTQQDLAAVAARLPQKTPEDMFAAVGRGELEAAEVLAAMFPDVPPPEPVKRQAMTRSDDGWFNLHRVAGMKFRWPGRPVYGRADLAAGIPEPGAEGGYPIRFAEGGAVPGERVVGILERGKGITIYPIHSRRLRDYEDAPDSWIDITWDIKEDSTERFPADITVSAVNEPGSLAAISKIIGETDGNIDKLQMLTRGKDYTEMLISLEVWDLKHLNAIISGLKALSSVSAVKRVMS